VIVLNELIECDLFISKKLFGYNDYLLEINDFRLFGSDSYY
jgi:hypothetical protein